MSFPLSILAYDQAEMLEPRSAMRSMSSMKSAEFMHSANLNKMLLYARNHTRSKRLQNGIAFARSDQGHYSAASQDVLLHVNGVVALSDRLAEQLKVSSIVDPFRAPSQQLICNRPAMACNSSSSRRLMQTISTAAGIADVLASRTRQ